MPPIRVAELGHQSRPPVVSPYVSRFITASGPVRRYRRRRNCRCLQRRLAACPSTSEINLPRRHVRDGVRQVAGCPSRS
jgi:hypothetical protein